MTVSEKIKILLLRRKKSQKEIAEILGMSAEGFNNKLRRDYFKPEELQKIGEALNCAVIIPPPLVPIFKMNETGEEI
jgi:transcriptional regulator with XRE-family HTH domain